MENTICDLCEAGDSSPFMLRRDRFSQESFQFVTCRICGMIYLNPRPTSAELGHFYPEAYEAFRNPVGDHTKPDQGDTGRALHKQLDFVESIAPGRGLLLDVGCATGNFLWAARQRGWQISGVEWVEPIARLAGERLGITVHSGSLETAGFTAGSFQAITFWDVLEHLPSPRHTLKRAHALLGSSGVLVFSIPNLVSFDRYLFGSYWIGWDAPRHFHLFSRQGVVRLLEETGFKLLEKRCFLGGKGAFLLSLDTLLERNPRADFIRKGYPLISAMLWPYRQFAYLVGRGPVITYLARKES